LKNNKNIDWENLNVLVTGGTGSFGKKFVEIMLRDFHPKKLIIFSRDELKQHEMKMNGFDHPSLRFFLGDVRDKERLHRAMQGVNIIIHAAALKQVPACEYNPFEAVKTNIIGAQNIIDAAIDARVEKVVALSTDKAVNPVNLYGATKLCAEKMFIQGNSYSGVGGTIFSCVRYGNVIGSRGSVIPLFISQKKKGKMTITDKRMTRFWITLDQAFKLVMSALLITEEEGRQAIEYNGMYIILPNYSWWNRQNYTKGKKLPKGFTYVSNTNLDWLSVNDLKAIIDNYADSIHWHPSIQPGEVGSDLVLQNELLSADIY
jgi:UDP-N-acetylglucosamine 4,6-dehydratase